MLVYVIEDLSFVLRNGTAVNCGGTWIWRRTSESLIGVVWVLNTAEKFLGHTTILLPHYPTFSLPPAFSRALPSCAGEKNRNNQDLALHPPPSPFGPFCDKDTLSHFTKPPLGQGSHAGRRGLKRGRLPAGEGEKALLDGFI